MSTLSNCCKKLRVSIMKAWQSKMRQLLSDTDAPPVLTRDLLKRYSRSANTNQSVATSSLTYWQRSMSASENLRPIQRGLYLNCFRAKPGVLADSIAWFHSDAVVSLNTVLGDSGVLNNPTTVVTAVVPIDRGRHPPARLGRKTTQAGVVHFFGIPRHILQAGEARDRLEAEEQHEHLRATPEKALVDWIYLGLSPRSRRTPPPRDDIDMERLDRRRLRRLIQATNLEQEFAAWLDQ